jgi:flagellar hook-associated protein 2
MIENLVQSYQTKITNLESKVTTYEWKQEAYRDIITDMVGFNTKYTSYTSSTNLSSKSFFNNATIVSSVGEYKDALAATGRTSSTVEINGVKSLASAARYVASTDQLSQSNVASSAVNLSDKVTVGTLSGSITLGYGGKSLYLSLDTDTAYESASDLAAAINKQLENQTISYDSGGSDKASLVVQAVADGDSIKFETVSSTDSNNVWIKSATNELETALGFTASSSSSKADSATTLKFDKSTATKEVDALDYLKEKGITVDLDGKSQKITFSDTDITAIKNAATDAEKNDKLKELLNSKLATAFGSVGSEQKVTADISSDGKLSFNLGTSYKNHSLTVSSDASKVLGFESNLSNYVDTSKKLSDVIDLNTIADTDKRTEKADDGTETTYYKLSINGKEVGEFTADTALETVISKINSNADAGVSVSYSKTTNMFVFTANETGADGKIEMTNSLSQALFGDTTAAGAKYTAGTDAVFTATVNGEEIELTRSSNSVDIDGLTVSLKDTFGYKADGSLERADDGVTAKNKVTFESKADADTIVSAIKSFVEEYNSMVTKIKKAYSTMPLQKSDGSSYDPLTDDDMSDMSDTAIANYEEKAKTGLLFGDYDLSACYEGLRSAVDTLASGTSLLSQIGITTSYSDGLTTLSLNESTLRSALETDPDKVRDVFTSNTENGGSYAGLMQGLSKQLNKYAAVTGATKGILIEKAGSTLAPTSIYSNTWQSAIDDLEDQIEKWQDKLSDKVDYYTSKFASLETLISEMNSQSSMLSQMMSGY